MVISQCRFCKKEIKFFKKRTFCSKECLVKEGEQKRTANCTLCKIKFTKRKGESFKTSHPFCTKSCWDKYQVGKNNPSWKGVGCNKLCKLCNKEFRIKNSLSLSQVFCSKQCYWKHNELFGHPLFQDLHDTCTICKISLRITKRKVGKKNFCSRVCADKHHSIFMKEELNSNYVNGQSGYVYHGYAVNWRIIRDEIRKRDNYRCQLCNIEEKECDKNLSVHHIDFNKHNNSDDNLITLCERCHNKHHGKKSRYQCKEELLKVLKEKKIAQDMFII
jgi:5-methylcytosine-specific restriction endonuclease McrA